MPRLLVHPDSPPTWEIELKAGVNTFGRGPANDFTINDPSVSTRHCEIIVNEGSVLIRDLGSTNGTHLGGARISESRLEHGQRLRLGGVDIMFYADPATSPGVPAPAMATPPVYAPVPQLAASTLATAGRPAGGAGLTAPAASVSTQSIPTASKFCRHHPKVVGRYACAQCAHVYCEACISARRVDGVVRKLCRHCGVELAPVQVQLRQEAPKGFFEMIPEAFVYPVRGGGIMMVFVGTALMVLLKAGALMMQYGTLRMIMYSIILQVLVGGYLYAFMQSVVQTSATGDPEMPHPPNVTNIWEDVLVPCFQFIGMTLICFGPSIGLAVWAAVSGEPAARIGSIVTSVFGYLYFPMAFLAVSVLDSVAAANPLVIIPSIFRVWKEYLVTLLVLGGVLGLRAAGDFMVAKVFPNGMDTDSMAELFGMFATRSFWALFGFYLLAVGMRILAHLFSTRKDELGWLRTA